MNQEVEKLLRQFDRDFRKNPDLRIENLKFDPSIYEAWSRAEQLDLWRQLILLETDLRYEFKQAMDKLDYESRFQQFPEYLEFIDEAFRRIDRLRAENSSARVMQVTLVFEGDAASDAPTVAVGGSGGSGRILVGAGGNNDIPNELGRFKEITKVGEGGFGIVCRAWDSEAEEYRALKFPTKLADRNGDFLTAVKKETSKSIGIEHPNIVKTFGMEVIEPYVFVVQEFVDGGDLKSWMEDEHSVEEKIEMVKGIAAGLQHVHSVPYEITHCDIKPANILVESNGNPKIGDFGLAFHEKDRLGQPAMIVGTPAYLAPMVAEGYIRQADGRADIFSLGVIFYEMLKGRRPFGGGDTHEIIREILIKDPTPIRISKPNISAELERICLRCLAKKTLERYQLASDLIEDLEAFGGSKVVSPPPSPKIVPRGIRSFTEEDNDFFLSLLPGVRDREDIPVSVSFWLRRIVEPVTDNERIPNGFLFGPSGSGKSSFVKAGLIPEIKKKSKQGDVTTIYVESTRDDTEVRILKALRHQFPEIPRDKKLSSVFAGLANGKWRGDEGPAKVLLVIDQFEQWISNYDPSRKEQLVKALKHCDGENLQSLMLVRDDFFLATLRFADSLDINLQEDENFKNIDLFDEAHARKILIKFGQAFGKLDEHEELISPEQQEFVKKTVEQLARNHFVVCVRLTLFAEMFKHRPWTVDELESVGGVAGVGEQFLESTFGEETSTVEFRGARRQIVQAILEELLPEKGSNIRGTMKTREELVAAAKCENKEQAFDQIIHKLHRDLTLITRTDPDASGETSVDDESTNAGVEYYQLTHDYLVPSIRNWLNTNLRNTRRGRAIIRLRELASQVVPGQKPKYLPGNFEWLYWQFSIRNEIRTEKERLVQHAGFRKVLASASVSLVMILILAVTWALVQNRMKQSELETQIVNRTQDLVGHGFEQVPQIVFDLQQLGEDAAEKIRRRLKNETGDSLIELRLRLGLLPFDHEGTDNIVLRAIQKDSGPVVIRTVGKLLREYSAFELYDALDLLNNADLEPHSKLRLVCLINIVKGKDWGVGDNTSVVLESLTNEPLGAIDQWVELLKLDGANYVQQLARRLELTEEGELLRATIFSDAFYIFADAQTRDRKLVEIIRAGNDSQFDAIFSTIEKHDQKKHFASLLLSECKSITDPDQLASVWSGIVRLGSTSNILESIENANPVLSRLFVNSLNPKRISSRHIFDNLIIARKKYRMAELGWLAIAEHSNRFSDSGLKKKIIAMAETKLRESIKPNVYSASELVLRRQKQGDKIDALRRQRKNSSSATESRGIFINCMNQPMAVLEQKNRSRIAMSTHEVSNKDWHLYCKDVGIDDNKTPVPHNGKPYRVIRFADVLKFCNWMTRKEGLEGEECYPENIVRKDILSIKADTSKKGYRLPTFAEWKQFQKPELDKAAIRLRLQLRGKVR